MRVGVDARDAADPASGGWGRYARCLIDALREEEDVELVLYERGSAGPELLFEQVGLPRRLRRDGVDLVHVPNCFLPLRRPCPGVVTVHDLAFEAFPDDFARGTGLKYRAITRRAVSSAQRVIVPSQATASDLEERYGADPAKIRVIAEASALRVPGPAYTPPAPRNGEILRFASGSAELPSSASGYLLHVGDLRAKKNVARLIDAYEVARASGLQQRLVMAGRGELPRRVEGVEQLGWIDDATLDGLYRSADFLVYPSLYEGFGLVALEAMTRGCPVALARATSLPEVGGDAAVYFDPLDVDDIADTMVRLASDESLRARLAELGRERAAQFSWARAARETVEVYREALSVPS